MCNRYGHWATLAALRARAAELQRELFTSAEMGNLEPHPNIYADQDAPILTNHDGGLMLRRARWGLPPFAEFDAKGRRNTPRNNIRKTDFWRQRSPELMHYAAHRCLVPFSAFAEPTRDSSWFRVPGEEVAFFAGVCMDWFGERLKAQPGKKRRARELDDWLLYAFLTTEANSVVAPVHPDAMPVVLTDPEDCAAWLAGGTDSYALQRALPDKQLEMFDLE